MYKNSLKRCYIITIAVNGVVWCGWLKATTQVIFIEFGLIYNTVQMFHLEVNIFTLNVWVVLLVTSNVQNIYKVKKVYNWRQKCS